MNHLYSGENNMPIARQRSFIERFSSKNLLGAALVGAGLAMTLSAGRAEATNFYVSPLGDNTTGTSYGTAFTEFNKIKWSLVKPNDSIVIDGGQSQTTYTTTLTLPANISPIGVVHSFDAGHTGTVILDGTSNASGIGINILSNNARVYGNVGQTQSIVLQHFTNSGVRIAQPAGTYLVLNGLSFVSDAIGIHAVSCNPNPNSGGNYLNTIQDCDFQDCSNAGILVAPTASLTATLCWFHNSVAPLSGKNAAGFISTTPTQSGPVGLFGITKSVFGPQLNYGIITQDNAGPCEVADCLFLDAFKSNLKFGMPPLIGSNYSFNNLSNVTAVSTGLNPNNQGHSTIVASAAQIQSSIFLGAQVKAQAGAMFYINQVEQNEEWQVTGNTTALAATQTNPLFIDPTIYTFPNNVSATTLINTDYRTQNGGFGSSVTSVADLQLLQNQ